MLTVKSLREAMVLIARAQTMLRESNDKRAIAEADRLDDNAHAIGAILDASTGTAR